MTVINALQKENGVGLGAGVQRRPLCQWQGQGGCYVEFWGWQEGQPREEAEGRQPSVSQGEAGADPSLTVLVLRGNHPASILLSTSTLQNGEKTNVCGLSPPICGVLLRQPEQQTQHCGAMRGGLWGAEPGHMSDVSGPMEMDSLMKFTED